MGARPSGIILAMCIALSGCGGGSSVSPSTNGSNAGPLPLTDVCGDTSASSGANWTTFGFDQLHSGCDPGQASITASTVGQLHKVWEFSQTDQIVASPIVVDGTVYIATLNTGTVIALNATTGAKEWSTTLGGSGNEIRQTPVYDAGMLFIGIHGFGPEQPSGEFPPQPSMMYALNAATGKVIWSTQVQGVVRSSPAIANGEVFVPVAGGDPPTCLQGGIDALNEQTGQLLWRFYVDPTPNDGGSVWSPVAYDGTHIIFGTGNTCVQTPLSANAIVALNPANGSVVWQLNTANQISDDDVGGGVLLVDGMAVALGKDGVIYFLDQATGAILHEVPTRVADGTGGFSTPATDGNTIVVGTSASVGTAAVTRPMEAAPFFGRIRTAASGGGGQLIALDLSGNVKWKILTSNPVRTTAAITNGIVFANLDDQFEALSLASGELLWSYSAPVQLLSSPVVVQSGLYTADLDGNVYKFAI